LPVTVSVTTDRRAAPRDADHVVNLTRICRLEASQSDIDVPLKHGVEQYVGDTHCAGGILYGQRNVPAILDFLRDVRYVARPGAIFFNYENKGAARKRIKSIDELRQDKA
jgi:alpha-galactosidase